MSSNSRIEKHHHDDGSLHKPVKKDMSRENVSDLVYRPPLLDGQEINQTYINYDQRRGWNNGIEQSDKYWEQEMKKSKWISVKDRLPEEDDLVLTLKDNDGVCQDYDLARYQQDSFSYTFLWINSSRDEIEVTHWQPLPKLPTS